MVSFSENMNGIQLDWPPFSETPLAHRRRIFTEDKAKVVASVWGPEFFQFLAAPATYFASFDLEEYIEFLLKYRSCEQEVAFLFCRIH